MLTDFNLIKSGIISTIDKKIQGYKSLNLDNSLNSSLTNRQLESLKGIIKQHWEMEIINFEFKYKYLLNIL